MSNHSKFAIFDLDGTLMDSMQYWYKFTFDYMGERGAKIDDETKSIMNAMSMFGSIKYLEETQGVKLDIPDMVDFIETNMGLHYATDIPIKDGVFQLLDFMKEEGFKMCILSATDTTLSVPAMEKRGLAPYFDFVMDCSEFPKGKNDAEVFKACAERLGADPEHTVVFEDSIKAIRTATSPELGYKVVAVACEFNLEDRDELHELSEVFIESDFRDSNLINFLKTV